MAKTVTLDFSKFFPTNQSFVSVRGNARHGDDFFVNLAFGDGDNKVTYYVSEYNTKEALKQMQAMLESIDKAVEFVSKAMALPPEERKSIDLPWLKDLALDDKPAKKAVKKKAAPKK